MDSVGKFRNSKVKRKSEYFELKDKSQSGKGDFIYGQEIQNYRTVPKINAHSLKQQETMRMILEDNESLKKKIVALQQRNNEIQTENQRLKNQLSRYKFIHAEQYKFLQKKLKSQQKQKSQNNLNDYFNGITSLLQYSNQSQESHKIKYQVSRTNEECKSTNANEKNESEDLVELVGNLKVQVNLLEKVKNRFRQKYKLEKQKNVLINGQLSMFIQEKDKYDKKLQQYIENNKKCEVEIAKLEMQLQEAFRDIHKLLVDEKKKEENIEHRHKRMHLEIEKLQLKNEKYKQRVQIYKMKKCQLGQQMKKAWRQVGGNPFKKWAPS